MCRHPAAMAFCGTRRRILTRPTNESGCALNWEEGVSMFLDPTKPLTTCSQSSCVGCQVADLVHCHFTGKDLGRFIGVFVVAVGIAGVGVYRANPWLILPWIALAVGYFGFIEIRVMCSHCPHYAEPGSSLKCWANYGSPKLWGYRPGPMTGAEKSVFLAGITLVLGYPLPLLIHQWALAALYLFIIAGAYGYMRTFMCSQCMNFACPLNLVDNHTKDAFLRLNPGIAQAWGRTDSG